MCQARRSNPASCVSWHMTIGPHQRFPFLRHQMNLSKQVRSTSRTGSANSLPEFLHFMFFGEGHFSRKLKYQTCFGQSTKSEVKQKPHSLFLCVSQNTAPLSLLVSCGFRDLTCSPKGGRNRQRRWASSDRSPAASAPPEIGPTSGGPLRTGGAQPARPSSII